MSNLVNIINVFYSMFLTTENLEIKYEEEPIIRPKSFALFLNNTRRCFIFLFREKLFKRKRIFQIILDYNIKKIQHP